MTAQTPNQPFALWHPIAVAALILLLLNDHVLKGRAPGVLTGRLSDIAWLTLAPLVLTAIWDLVRVPRTTRIAVFASSVAFVTTLFVVAKLSTVGAASVGALIGALQTPVRGFFRPAPVWVDPSDLWTLPSLLLAWIVVRQTGSDFSRT